MKYRGANHALRGKSSTISVNKHGTKRMNQQLSNSNKAKQLLVKFSCETKRKIYVQDHRWKRNFTRCSFGKLHLQAQNTMFMLLITFSFVSMVHTKFHHFHLVAPTTRNTALLPDTSSKMTTFFEGYRNAFSINSPISSWFRNLYYGFCWSEQGILYYPPRLWEETQSNLDCRNQNSPPPL